MANGIIVGGVIHAIVGVNVRTWLETGIQFRVGDGFNKRRRHEIDLAVWHWTGGEGDPEQLAKTLQARELGVEFAIARNGDVWQFCDPLIVDTADAGAVNPRSVGIEMVCYGTPTIKTLWRVPKRGRDRQVYEAVVHESSRKIGMFYTAQIESACKLADALSSALPGITRQVPETSARVLLPTELKRFSGHLGHYHLSHKKLDPGPHLLEVFWDHFHATAEPITKPIPLFKPEPNA